MSFGSKATSFAEGRIGKDSQHQRKDHGQEKDLL